MRHATCYVFAPEVPVPTLVVEDSCDGGTPEVPVPAPFFKGKGQLRRTPRCVPEVPVPTLVVEDSCDEESPEVPVPN